MSHPVPGHDYSERTKHESRSEYSRRKGAATGKVNSSLPKSFISEMRGARKGVKKMKKMNAAFKALLNKKDN